MNKFLFYNCLRFDSFRSCLLAYLLGASFCNGFATLSLMQNLSDGRMSGAIPCSGRACMHTYKWI